MHADLRHRIALTMVPTIGPVLQKKLLEHFSNPADIFKASKTALCQIDGIGEWTASNIKGWNDFKRVDEEMNFIQKHAIQPLMIGDHFYPTRLMNCYDAPTLLYYKGNALLNETRIISIIGTRTNSHYGRSVTEKLIEQLPSNTTVISGLAFGIDAIAHRAALKNKQNTIGVLAHGLDNLYPRAHRSLAKEMIEQGGLLTEFNRNTPTDKYNFPRRNRIVAGMSDATVVIETAVKGGSMITADLAFHYNRELFAVPGKINDPKSSGCLKLIQENKAILFSSPEHLLETLNWSAKKDPFKKHLELFESLNHEEKILIELLQKESSISMEELLIKTGFNAGKMAGIILNLELQQMIQVIPGKKIALA
ncbi:MAG: DNA-protecting protein DprA [Sphingobacteriia bacterium]|nr:MAG: DNA-protecting protein DprA [Sphingobacteriia bacterium]